MLVAGVFFIAAVPRADFLVRVFDDAKQLPLGLQCRRTPDAAARARQDIEADEIVLPRHDVNFFTSFLLRVQPLDDIGAPFAIMRHLLGGNRLRELFREFRLDRILRHKCRSFKLVAALPQHDLRVEQRHLRDGHAVRKLCVALHGLLRLREQVEGLLQHGGLVQIVARMRVDADMAFRVGADGLVQ